MKIKNELLLTEKQIEQLGKQVTKHHNVQSREELEAFMNSLDCVVKINTITNEIKFCPKNKCNYFYFVDLE